MKYFILSIFSLFLIIFLFSLRFSIVKSKSSEEIASILKLYINTNRFQPNQRSWRIANPSYPDVISEMENDYSSIVNVLYDMSSKWNNQYMIWLAFSRKVLFVNYFYYETEDREFLADELEIVAKDIGLDIWSSLNKLVYWYFLSFIQSLGKLFY